MRQGRGGRLARAADVDGGQAEAFGAEEVSLAIIADHHRLMRSDTAQSTAEDLRFGLANDGHGSTRHGGTKGGEQGPRLDQRAAGAIGAPTVGIGDDDRNAAMGRRHQALQTIGIEGGIVAQQHHIGSVVDEVKPRGGRPRSDRH